MKETLRQSAWRPDGNHSSSISSPSSPSFSSGVMCSGSGAVDPASNISAAAAIDGGRALAQLLYEFFRFYAYEFNPYSHVISLRYNSPPTRMPTAKAKAGDCVWSPSPTVEKEATEEMCWWRREPRERASILKMRRPNGASLPFALGFADLHRGVFLRKIDLALWMGNPRVPIHRHQWKLMNTIIPRQPLPPRRQERARNSHSIVKGDVSSSLSTDTHKFLVALAAETIWSALEDEETPPAHVVQQRQWLQDWEAVGDDHRKTFLDKYSAVGRRMDMLQFGTFVVEDPFRELEVLQPKFEKQDRLCYELKRATHLLAFASEDDRERGRAEGIQVSDGREALEALFRPFDPVLERDMLRFTADAARFMREELAEPSTEKEEAFVHATSLSER
uniref:PAP-associated domain-containing protein n=1 Tax=Neospora caninum (strain Liverpool) TaxID=572307 RepID=A0A0F7UK54_NEOCL|nr:TPA: hypothetical protein BN1204_042580 [Neospora caninum Liverpool]